MLACWCQKKIFTASWKNINSLSLTSVTQHQSIFMSTHPATGERNTNTALAPVTTLEPSNVNPASLSTYEEIRYLRVIVDRALPLLM